MFDAAASRDFEIEGTKIVEYRGYGGDVTIPDGITEIGEYAFCECNGLTSVYLPDSIIAIGFCAFEYCPSLSRVYVPDLTSWLTRNIAGREYLPLKDFYSDGELVEDVLITGIEELPDGAFYECQSLKSVRLSDDVKAIGRWAFHWCFNLESVSFSENMRIIGKGAFSHCSNNLLLHVPDLTLWVTEKIEGREEIPEYRLIVKDALVENAMIEATAENIDDEALYGCTSLRTLRFKEGVKTLGRYSFANCRNLEAVYLPGSLTSLGYRPFADCNNLRAVHVPDVAKWLSSPIKGRISLELSDFYEGDTLVEDLTIGPEVTEIPEWAFFKCRSLKTVRIAQGITRVGTSAFCRCCALESVTLPESLTEIADSAFYGCTGLKGVRLPDSVNVIGQEAFDPACELTGAMAEAYKKAEDERIRKEEAEDHFYSEEYDYYERGENWRSKNS